VNLNVIGEGLALLAAVISLAGNVAMGRWLRQARAQRDEALAQYDRLVRETFIGEKPSWPVVHGEDER
jgi:hypothetical protein